MEPAGFLAGLQRFDWGEKNFYENTMVSHLRWVYTRAFHRLGWISVRTIVPLIHTHNNIGIIQSDEGLD